MKIKSLHSRFDRWRTHKYFYKANFLTLGICWNDLTASKNLVCISLTWLSKLLPPAPPTLAVHVSISKCCVVCTSSRTSLHLSMKLFSDVKQTLFLAGHGESVQSSRVSRLLPPTLKLLFWWKILFVLGVRLSLYSLLCQTIPPLSILIKSPMIHYYYSRTSIIRTRLDLSKKSG